MMKTLPLYSSMSSLNHSTQISGSDFSVSDLVFCLLAYLLLFCSSCLYRFYDFISFFLGIFDFFLIFSFQLNYQKFTINYVVIILIYEIFRKCPEKIPGMTVRLLVFVYIPTPRHSTSL